MFNDTLTISGPSGQYSLVRSGEDKVLRQISLPAALPGAVTSGTTDRLLTLGAGHGITSADKVGVFWQGGQRIEMTVSTTDATTITVTAASGLGQAFPANATSIMVSVGTARTDMAFDATELQMLQAGCPAQAGTVYEAAVNFLDGGGASLLAAVIAGGECFAWASESGAAQPLTGTVASIDCYSGSPAATQLNIYALLS